MVRIQQWQCERAGLDTANIHRDEAEASTSYGGEHFAAEWIKDRTNEIGRGQFDSGDLIVVPSTEGVLGPPSSPNPSCRRAASARSIWLSFSGVTG